MSHSTTENTENEIQQAKHMPKQVFSITGDNKHSALELLHENTALSKKTLKDAASKGAVWIDRQSRINSQQTSKVVRLRRLKKILDVKHRVDFYYQANILEHQPSAPTLIDDSQDYSVWIKPRGMLSQGSKWGDHNALYRWVEMHFQTNSASPNQARQCWIVHRLDRATCGLMLLAHTKKMASELSKLFEKNKVNKTYRAWVWGQLHSTTQTITTPIDDKHAISHITALNYHKEANASLVEIKIETGRKHQIRTHLASINHPIIGDRLHGSDDLDARFASRPDLQLTAFKLEFTDPASGQLKNYLLKDKEMALLTNDDLTTEFAP